MFCSNLDATKQTDSILVRSENCTQLVKEKEKETTSFYTRTLLYIVLPCAVILLSPYLTAMIEDRSTSSVEPISSPLQLLILAVVIIAAVWVFTACRRVEEFYSTYTRYCSAEVLIADETKVYGSTAQGSFSLLYSEIDAVSSTPNIQSIIAQQPAVPNDIFTIVDTAGNRFKFYSFKNCNDLKVVIDMQIRRVRDDKVQ